MLEDGKIFIGKSTKPEYLDLRLANRHGLITGATGTGKTVSLPLPICHRDQCRRFPPYRLLD